MNDLEVFTEDQLHAMHLNACVFAADMFNAAREVTAQMAAMPSPLLSMDVPAYDDLAKMHAVCMASGREAAELAQSISAEMTRRHTEAHDA